MAAPSPPAGAWPRRQRRRAAREACSNLIGSKFQYVNNICQIKVYLNKTKRGQNQLSFRRCGTNHQQNTTVNQQDHNKRGCGRRQKNMHAKLSVAYVSCRFLRARLKHEKSVVDNWCSYSYPQSFVVLKYCALVLVRIKGAYVAIPAATGCR